MKIGTLNIDWFRKSKTLQELIIVELNRQDFDFLIVTENILSFQFNKNYFHYHTNTIPIDSEFQHLHYGQYLTNEIPIRTSLFSKHQSITQIDTTDPYTSICHKFLIDEREICIYATIIGTYGIKYQKEIAKPELDNFKADIRHISLSSDNIFIVGDFNTSFDEKERRQLSVIQSRNEIIKFTNHLSIIRTTETIKETIDHIFISENLYNLAHATPHTFLDNDILKDKPHKGIFLDINFKA